MFPNHSYSFAVPLSEERMFNCERQKVLLIRSKMRMLRQIQLKFLSASADTLRKQKKKSPPSELLFRDTIRTRIVLDSLTFLRVI